MFDRYTPDARQAILIARYEASLLGATTLETEHLWLGILQQSKRLVKRHAPRVTAETVRGRILELHAVRPRVSLAADVALSPSLQRVFAEAGGADPQSQSPIRVDDLIVALLQQERLAPATGSEQATGSTP
jgi:ATP-dependent Clp protease ATP-binding subunit ClpA